MTRHLHGDYHFSYCGLDASHIPMTYDPDESDCDLCLEYADAHEGQLAEHAAELQAAEKAEIAAAAEREAALRAAIEERLRRIEAALMAANAT